jgi:hypothetical protein
MLKKALLIAIICLLVGCSERVPAKYQVGDVVVTKIDNRKGIITSASGSMYLNGHPTYWIRFAARVEDATTTALYETEVMREYEIELYNEDKE